MSKISDSFKKSFNKRSLKYGSNSVILIAAVVAIAIVLNLLVNMVPVKWDLTPNKLYSIGDTTKDILKKLDKDVTVYCLFDYSEKGRNESLRQVIELLEKYNGYSSHLNIKYIDPDKNPDVVESLYNDTGKSTELSAGDIVVKSEKRIKRITQDELFEVQYDQYGNSQATGLSAEQAFTGAIKYVTLDRVPSVYFAQGHGEAKMDEAFQTLKQYLEYNGYNSKDLSLINNEIPADADFLMFLSPKKDLTPDEGRKVKEYLKNGGKAMFVVDPITPNQKLDVFNGVLSEYNLSFNYDKVREKDEDRRVNDETILLTPLENNSINQALYSQDWQLILPNVRSISVLKNEKENLTVTPLIQTSDEAVGQQIVDNKEVAGPLDLAAMAEYKSSDITTKVFVMGNSMFMTDAFLRQYPYGFRFFSNSMEWMHEQKDQVSIQPKEYDVRTMELSDAVVKTLTFSLMLVLPLIILMIGTIVWYRRRHL